MKNLFICAVFFLATPLFAHEHNSIINFANVEMDIQASLAPLPGSTDQYYLKVVSKRELPSSTAVVLKAKEQAGFNYRAIGGVWTYWLDEHFEKTLVKGTVTEYLTLFHGDGKQPIKLFRQGEPSHAVTLAKLNEDYLQENNLGPFTNREVASKTLDSPLGQLNKACKSTIKTQVDWNGFTAKNGVFEAASVVHLLNAMQELCKDKDYATAIRALKSIQVQSSKEDRLNVAVTGPAVTVKIGPNIYNPRFQYPALIKAAL